MRLFILTLCVPVLSVLPSVGCSLFDGERLASTNREEVPNPTVPVRQIVCTWEGGEGRGLDDRPARGFAGQILFFRGDNPDPAAVNGSVLIEVFDEQTGFDADAKPLHAFRFTGEAWSNYQRETRSLGTVYQVFLPYTRKTNEKRQCALRVTYEEEIQGWSAPPVYSTLTQILLDGKTPTRRVTAKQQVNRRPANSQTDRIDHMLDEMLKERVRRPLRPAAAPEQPAVPIDTTPPRTFRLTPAAPPATHPNGSATTPPQNFSWR